MFSIIIPTYNRDEDLKECLHSIKENSKLINEIIVLFDGNEETSKICNEYNAKILYDNARKNGKRVKGLWAILNEGIKVASNDYVMYLNDDCLVLPEWDLIAKKYFENDLNLGLLVLKTKGIGQNPNFRIHYTRNNIPCANYAIINKKSGLYFDELYDWFYGDADLPFQFAAFSEYAVKCTEENMVVHNHKIDENRIEHESNIMQISQDELRFKQKWNNYFEINGKLRKINIFCRILKLVKMIIKKVIKKIVIKKESKIVNNTFVDNKSFIGEYSYIGNFCVISKAIIGRYCSIGNFVTIGPGEHELDRVSTSCEVYPNENWYDVLTKKECIIGNDVWIGVGSVIRRGVKIGDGAVIGANSFVNKDVPDFAVVAGNPAKLIRYRFSEKIISIIKESNWWNLDKNDAIKKISEITSLIGARDENV